MYTISKNYEKEYFYIFMNQSLGQFLLCLAHYNLFQAAENTRIKESQRQTAKDARAEYEALKEKLHNIDTKAVENEGLYWGQCLFGLLIHVESLEEDEEALNDNE